MKSPYLHDQYELVVDVYWQLKPGVITTIKCTSCGGQGQLTGFGRLEDETCSKCMGSGTLRNPDLAWRPEVPATFRNHVVGHARDFVKRYFRPKTDD